MLGGIYRLMGKLVIINRINFSAIIYLAIIYQIDPALLMTRHQFYMDGVTKPMACFQSAP